MDGSLLGIAVGATVNAVVGVMLGSAVVGCMGTGDGPAVGMMLGCGVGWDVGIVDIGFVTMMLGIGVGSGVGRGVEFGVGIPAVSIRLESDGVESNVEVDASAGTAAVIGELVGFAERAALGTAIGASVE